tara:strand:+ start:391 stop:570 length:180 start_codon:yes stop_codon:yes gene_type:complete
MAYNGVTIETAVHDEDLSSHCIPAYPLYDSSTTFDAAFYTKRQDTNDDLVTGTITLTEV